MTRRILLLALAITCAYGAVVAGLALAQRRLIFRPDPAPPDPGLAAAMGAAPLSVPTADGLALLSWYLAPPDPAAPVVLYLQGNAGSIANRAYRLAGFRGLGWGALLLGYRGYGGNAGAPSEAGLLTDARAALAALARRHIPPTRIVVWGESLGTGVAVQLAAETRFAAMVLEAPYTSLTAVARQKLPWVPVGLLLRDRFDSLARIGAVHCPLFMLVGERDTLIPPAMSRVLFAAANAPKQLFSQAEAGHGGQATPAAFAAVAAFVAAQFPATSAGQARME